MLGKVTSPYFFFLSTEKRSEVKEDEVLLDEEHRPFTDDPKDQTYEPRTQRYSLCVAKLETTVFC